MRQARFLAALLALAALGGCAQYRLGPPVASIDNIRAARSLPLAPVALGEFRLAPGRPAGIDRSIGMRTNTISSPYGESFAQYLKESLAADLGAAGLLDPASSIVVSAELNDTAMDIPPGAGSARLAARVKVTRSGRIAFDKELIVESTWPSSFVGVNAIVTAVNEYGLLYRKLVRQLLADPEFVAAARQS
ncbi:hypothetical protein [Ramlibacter sp. PS4R-6]|uniref:hypothetical protein n=1 Tax=Ramlibacter sp. PS4R-6 TaxID=3133438 RepID=UPI0030A37D33